MNGPSVAGAIDAAGRWLARRRMQRYRSAPAGTTALVLVDVQRDLFDPDTGAGLVATVGEPMNYWSNLKALVARCRAEGIAVIHAPVVVPTSPHHPVHELAYFRALQGAGAVRMGMRGAEIPAELVQADDTVLVPRRTLNAFYDTSLSDELMRRGVTHVLIAGSVCNASVDSTARMAVELDYCVTVPSDCVSALAPRDWTYSVEVTLPRLVHFVRPARAIRFG